MVCGVRRTFARTWVARGGMKGVVQTGTGWASREVVWIFAGRFSNQIFELDPEIWYGHSLGYDKKL